MDTQDSLDGKKLIGWHQWWAHWQLKMTTRISSLNLRYIKANEEDKWEISMIEIMIREVIKIDIGQIVEIGEYHSVVEYNMDRITETDQGIIRTIEVILEEDILEIISNQIKIMLYNAMLL